MKENKVNDGRRVVAPKFISGFFTLTFILLLIVVANINLTSAETNYCAERTISGAWCQNVPLEQVNENFRKAPTSCDSTSFCKLGTCINSNEGTCSANVPQRVCQDDGGVWDERNTGEISQCQLGCCLLGDQAAFVTQTKCKAIASDYGTETEYRSDIRTEIECLATANPDVKGACVFASETRRDCEMLTKKECLAREEQTGSNTVVEFHEGFLCSAESLATDCGPSEKTACLPDKDGVYFLDTCGNVANIYDASKVEDQEYWTRIKEVSESCNPNPLNGNAGSKTCGNCDYLLGSMCKPVQRGNSATPQPQYGNFVCADLSCKYQNKIYKHGESWCSGTSGVNNSLVGSEHVRLVCYNGEVTAEECSAFRQEICAQDEINTTQGGYKTAQCKANIWQDCIFQESKADCEDITNRDCKWLEGQSLLKDDSGTPLVINGEGELVPAGQGQKVPIEGSFIFNTNIPQTKEIGAACVPRYPPGFNFWSEESEAEELCAMANDNCRVKFEKSASTGFSLECKENCECLGLSKGAKWSTGYDRNSNWIKNHNNMCIALGDCGAKKNYIGVQGYYNQSDAITFGEAK